MFEKLVGLISEYAHDGFYHAAEKLNRFVYVLQGQDYSKVILKNLCYLALGS